jgi:hypothetical protein
MKGHFTIKGMDQVVANINKQLVKMKGDAMEGMIDAAILIRTDMENTSPKVPIDLGNLRASFFVVTSRGESKVGGSPNFKGEEASEMASGHSTVVSNSKQLAVGSGRASVILGFSANYAIYVHENVGAKFHYTDIKTKKTHGRPGAGAKFFEAAWERNKKQVLILIKNNMTKR